MNPAETNRAIVPDPFWDMVVQLKTSGSSAANVRVSFGDTVECLDTAGRRRWPKCEISVQIECPQSEAFINQAREYAYRYAVAFVNAAMSRIIPDYTPVVIGG